MGQDPYEIRLNVQSLGLTRERIQAQGPDLVGEGRTFRLTDTSGGGMNWITFKHNESKDEAISAPMEERSRMAFAPDTPGAHYFDQALIALRTSQNIPPGTFTKEQEERLAGSLSEAALSTTPPLTRIDHIVLSKARTDTGQPDRIFVVQGELTDPAHNRAQLPLDQALAKPLEQSSERVNELVMAQQREQARVQTQAMEQQQVQGPAMRMGGP